MSKELTRSAQCAKVIRQELKVKFPSVKFRIRSSNFSGGNSVDIDWENGPTYDMINDITSKYQYGNFNGMIDMYEHNNDREDIPQVKFVMCQRNITQNHYDAMKAKLSKDYNVDMSDDIACWDKFNCYPDTACYRKLHGMVL